MTDSKFIYGKDETQNIVAIDVNDGSSDLYIETPEGVTVRTVPDFYWMLTHKYVDGAQRLKGGLHYQYVSKYPTEADFRAAIGDFRRTRVDYHAIYNPKEMSMLRNGTTYYKGMNPSDVSVLSFDLETTSLLEGNGIVVLISNTFRKNGKVTRRLFSYDDYQSQEEFIQDWCDWVNVCDPSIIVGHNIFGFDLPFLRKASGGDLPIGRDKSDCQFATYTSVVRKDGSQSYDYTNVTLRGREFVDTFHLALKYDIARNYDSYGLKAIVKAEGLEREDRQHYDASTIKDNYKNPVEWAKIKEYAEHDADDSLALFDLMIPSFFYFCQSIPKSLQQVVSGASGAQVDAFMKRAYLQEGHSLPNNSEAVPFEGAISFGNPGMYTNCFKVDFASLYPSIMRQHKVYNKKKDPKAYFLKMVETFTERRLLHKRLANETGDRYYKDMEQAEKIFVNSSYGFLGANGLLFNSPEHAAFVTMKGRELMGQLVKWATGEGHHAKVD